MPPVAPPSLSHRPPLADQVDRLVRLGYAQASGLGESVFRSLFAGVRNAATQAEGPGPAVLVVPRTLVGTPDALARVEHRGHAGVLDMTGARPLADYRAIDGVAPPPGPYLLDDVTLGDPSGGPPPAGALPAMTAAGRSPLTIDEGVAVVTQLPEVFEAVTGLWLMGETSGDRRVPALWISKGRPRLGWCWQGTPHDWLAPASCAGRVEL